MPRILSPQPEAKPDKPPKPDLVATFSGFPGVSIPLILGEERIARDIERRDFPPFES